MTRPRKHWAGRRAMVDNGNLMDMGAGVAR